ncbi:MAG: hypothetical protein AAFX10_02410 [Pseudomonadota bacterium]
MKSLLVDALRAANDDASSDDEARPTAAEARADSDLAGYTDRGELTGDDFEILEPDALNDALLESGFTPTDETMPGIARVDEAERSDEPESPPEREQRFEAARAPATIALAAAPSDSGLIERAARNTPYLCLALALISTLAYTVWHGIAQPGGQASLLAGTSYGVPAGTSTLVVDNEPPQPRFALDTTRSTPPAPQASQPSAAIVREAAPVIVRRNVPGPAKPAGQTGADDETFVTLNAAYRAYLGGEVGRDYIDWLLQLRAADGSSATELELRLLLQQYPDEALLHRALGTALAATGRMPEAEASMAEAHGLETGRARGGKR